MFEAASPRPWIGDENWTHTFFSLKLFGHPRISWQNPGISRKKSLISLVSRDISNFWPPPLYMEDPLPHRKISGLKSLGLCSFLMSKRKRVAWGEVGWTRRNKGNKAAKKTRKAWESGLMIGPNPALTAMFISVVYILEVPWVRLSISRVKDGTNPETPRKCSRSNSEFPGFARLEILKPWKIKHIPSPD